MSNQNPLERMKQRIKSGATSSLHMEMMQPTIYQDKNNNVNNQTADHTTSTTTSAQPPRERKMKFEDLHTRTSIWVDNDLRATLDNVADGERGVKTRIINDALRAYFESNSIEIIKVNKQ